MRGCKTYISHTFGSALARTGGDGAGGVELCGGLGGSGNGGDGIGGGGDGGGDGGAGGGIGGGGGGGIGGGGGGAADSTGAETVAPVMFSSARAEVTLVDASACIAALIPPLRLSLPANITNTVALKATAGGATATDAPIIVPMSEEAEPPDPRLATSPPAAADVATLVTVKDTEVVAELDAAAAATNNLEKAATKSAWLAGHVAGGADAPSKTMSEAGTPRAVPTAAARDEAFTQPPGAKEMFSNDETGRERERGARVRQGNTRATAAML